MGTLQALRPSWPARAGLLASLSLLWLGRPGPVAGAAASAPPGSVTFTRDVAPILFRHCVDCHRPGAAGPFSLLTYADARARARLIALTTRRRVMPPWQPLPEGPAFKGARRLDEHDVQVLERWVADGAPEGDAADLPDAPAVTPGWHLGPPDLVVSMPEPFEVRAGGADFFQNFVLPVPPAARRYVQAVEFRPGNPQVVHHARVMVDDTGESRRLDAASPGPGFEGMDTPGARFPDGYFLGWAAGKVPKREATAWPLDPGMDLVAQLHLRPSGRVERVQVSVGLYFTDTPPAFTPVMLQMGARTLDIPANEPAYEVVDTYTLPVTASLVRIAPHAHYLGHRMHLSAAVPGAAPITLLHIPDWDFNWQDDYDYVDPVRLPAGTRLTMRFTYDNSASNPRNPHAPPRRVAFGSEATDEMCELLLQLVPETPADLPQLQADVHRKTLAIETAEIEKRLADHPDEIETRLSLGAIYMQTGRFADGARTFDAAARLAPDHPIAAYNAGLVAFRGRDDGRARELLERAVRLKPDFVEARTTLALVLERGGDDAGAIAHYRAALAGRPGHQPAATNLSRALIRRGAWVDAAGVAERALGERPRDPTLLDALAEARQGAGAAPEVRDLDGRPVTTQVPGTRAVVLLFVGTDCPVSNRYAPEIRRLYDRFAAQGVAFVTVYPNPAETAASIRDHVAEYRLPPRAVHDRAHRLVARSGVAITPEVAVYDERGRMVYRGRIDDRYASIGVERPAPTRRDLEDVLAALLEGNLPALRTTDAVGCFIADLAR